MAGKPFSPFASKAKPKVVKTRDALDVAARNFIYTLYDATRRDRDPMGAAEGNIRIPSNDRAGCGARLGSPSASAGRQSAPERGCANRRRTETGTHGTIARN